MKIKLFLALYFILNFNGFSQTQTYLDSVSKVIQTLPKSQQIKIIDAIPYDEAVSNIKVFDTLSNKAIQYSIDLKDSLLLAKSYQQKILALHFTSKTEEALKLSLKTIRIYEQLQDTLALGNMYSELAWKLKYRDLDKAFSYMKKGLRLREKFKDNIDLYSSYDNFGVLHGMKKQWDSAIFYHNKVLKFRKKVKDSIGLPFAYSHLANVYLKTQKFDLAEIYLDSSLIIREARKDIYGITDLQLYFGDLFYAKKDYSKAIVNFEKAYNLSNQYKYYPLKKYASEYLFKSYKAIGQYKNALNYYTLYNVLKDSVVNVKTNSKIAELEIEYETEKKEKEILLQRVDISEKEQNLKMKNIQLLGLVFLAIVLSVLGYLIYNQQKLKNKQLKKEGELKEALIKIETQNQLQEQRLRISRDLHDNIGAQLTFIISSIDNLKYGFKITNNKVNHSLSNISEFTKDTIYELRDTIWAMNKGEISLEDLQARVSNFIDKATVSATKTEFNFNIDETLLRDMKFASVVGMNVYRIIQESLNNAIKYAQASNVNIEIKKDLKKVKFIISDDGIGFSKNEIEYGNGLNNIEKRAKDINATINIDSVLEKGTKIELTV